MPFYIRRRVPVRRNTWLNLSKTGVSASKRIGRLTVNTRGTAWFRILKGFYWRQR
jgi:hypothetical protein